MSEIYPLEWLDILILQTLNPKKSDLSKLSENDFSLISENLLEESLKIQVGIKTRIFALRKKREIQLLIKKYHSSLIFLLDSIFENQKDLQINSRYLSEVIETLIAVLEELLLFVENRFQYYLSLDERMPITYLMVSRKELLSKINTIKNRKDIAVHDGKSVEIAINEVFIWTESNKTDKITYRQMIYMRELLHVLDNLEYLDVKQTYFSPLEELLIGLNFNCLNYINYLIERINESISSNELKSIKLNELLCWYKKFNQLYINENITFDPSFQNIKDVLDNWFIYEIEYLQRQTEIIVDVKSVQLIKQKSRIQKVNKIECDLSVDQLGLILRAADEVRILKARSMNLVFQKIVPHLSTPLRKDLSYQSVRSKSYNAEERDKEIAILSLEKIIKKIRTY